MRLKNILIVVKDIEHSKAFYRELFGLIAVADFGSNVILTEGLVLQEQNIWEGLTGTSVTSYGNSMELYFEERDMDAFLEILLNCQYDIKYVNPLMVNEAGQRVVRFYDLDGHVIEVKEICKKTR